MTKPVSKGGRVPQAQKTQTPSDFYDGSDLNLFQVDPEVQKAMDAKGLAARWINVSKYKAGGNFHLKGWRAYKHEDSSASTRGSLDFNMGVSPEGYIIRGDMLLACMPKENFERRTVKKREAAVLKSGSQATKAAELREKIRESGVKTKVYEGYEANGDGHDEE